jgi:hypothetical protein
VDRCRTPHHADCFEMMERCAVYACGGTRVRPARFRAATAPECPRCGDEIRSDRVARFSCREAHHRACFRRSGACGVIGCGGRRYRLA